MGKRSAGKRGKLAERTKYLASLGLTAVPRPKRCPRCGENCFLVVNPKGKAFWVSTRGRVSCPL